MNTSRPVSASCSRKKPPPPIPELIGSTTESAADTAIAASKALPPSRMISRPASVASECREAVRRPGGAAGADGWPSAGAGLATAARSQAGAATRAAARTRTYQGFMATPLQIGCASRRGLQPAQLGQQLGFGFGMGGVRVDALHRAHHDALGLVEMAHAFGAQRRIDHVDRFTLRNRRVGTGRFADVAVDAKLVDSQRHKGSMWRLATDGPRTPPRPLLAAGPGLAPGRQQRLGAPAYFWMKMYSTPAGATACCTRSLSASSPMNSTRTPSMVASGTSSKARTARSAVRPESAPAQARRLPRTMPRARSLSARSARRRYSAAASLVCDASSGPVVS